MKVLVNIEGKIVRASITRVSSEGMVSLQFENEIYFISNNMMNVWIKHPELIFTKTLTESKHVFFLD